MQHIAIMKPSWKLIPSILSGRKTIESRWYQSRRAPWDRIKKGDIVYFKNSGQAVTAQALVSKVMQFSFSDITEVEAVVKKYGKQIGLLHRDPKTWGRVPKYCILIFLEQPTLLKKSFNINKAGFGSAAAWLCVEEVRNIIMV